MAKYGWEVTTAATGSVLRTSDLRRQLSIPDSEHYHDEQLELMGESAVSLFEQSTRRLLLSRVITLTMDDLPCTGPIAIPVYPVTTFTSLTVDGDLWDAANYVTDLVSVPNRVSPIADGTWPTTDNVIASVSMVMTVGYAVADIPMDIFHSLMMLVGHWFENRESTGGSMTEVPWGTRAIWDRYNMGETYIVGAHL